MCCDVERYTQRVKTDHTGKMSQTIFLIHNWFKGSINEATSQEGDIKGLGDIMLLTLVEVVSLWMKTQNIWNVLTWEKTFSKSLKLHIWLSKVSLILFHRTSGEAVSHLLRDLSLVPVYASHYQDPTACLVYSLYFSWYTSFFMWRKIWGRDALKERRLGKCVHDLCNVLNCLPLGCMI